jgi:hypothetical protein
MQYIFLRVLASYFNRARKKIQLRKALFHYVTLCTAYISEDHYNKNTEKYYSSKTETT